MESVEHSTRAHALLSASGASRWLNCTPSARLEDTFPDSGSSSFAEEGTLAHEFADIGLRLADGQITQEAYNKLQTEFKTNEHYSPEMDVEVAKYVDFIMEEYLAAKKRTPGTILSVEEKLDLTRWVPDGFGTNDAVIISDGVLDIYDLKYGKGIRVDADDNPQLKLYGLGALDIHELSYDIHTVRLNIIQPRLDHFSCWEISVEDLIKWGDHTVKPTAAKADQGKGVQKAGDWCKWCKAKATCATLASVNVKLAKNDFADPRTLSDDQVLEVFNKIPLLVMWSEAVKKYVFETAKDGKVWPGYKMVAGRSARKWTDEELVKARLLDNLFEPSEYTNVKLKGIGDIEKLVKKSNFYDVLGDLVIKPAGAPTLVKADDKRPAIGLETAKVDFKD